MLMRLQVLARPAEAGKLHRLPKICNERDSQYTELYALYNTKLMLYANYANKRFRTSECNETNIG
jgi:hypothetical protein